MKVVVFGASGVIGRAITGEVLVRGHTGTAATRAGVRRLVVVGGAGGLETAPGQRLLDSPDFPPAWKPTALAHARAFEEVYRGIDDLDWTYICPAGQLGPGERTGEFRIGGDQLLVDERGESRISVADYAIAFADELEHAEAVRRRITVAYLAAFRDGFTCLPPAEVGAVG